MRICVTAWIVLLAGFVCFSCSDDEGSPAGPIPEFPPATSVVMEFETFGLTNSRVQSFQNAMRAGGHVASWKNFVMNDNAIPVNAYLALKDKSPSFSEDYWVWQYDFIAADTSYTASFQGKETSEGKTWRLYVSQPGEFTEKLLMTGFSAPDNLTGYWNLYNVNNPDTAQLTIDWQLNSDQKAEKMTYEHQEASYITFEVISSDQYDAMYTLSNYENQVKIMWNRDKKDGQITEPAFYQDELPHCWNSTFEDISCL